MREILFRAKEKETGVWVEGDLVRDLDCFGESKTCIYQITVKGCWRKYFVDPETVCQYTGLTDKNGRKIFENDIVKQFADCNEMGENLYFFYQIRWSKEYCAFEGLEIYTKETFLFPDMEDIEVIGNIFDNPELIGE